MEIINFSQHNTATSAGSPGLSEIKGCKTNLLSYTLQYKKIAHQHL